MKGDQLFRTGLKKVDQIPKKVTWMLLTLLLLLYTLGVSNQENIFVVVKQLMKSVLTLKDVHAICLIVRSVE